MRANHTKSLMLLVLVALALTQVVQAATTNANDPRALTESYRRAFEARDINGIMSVYAPGSQLFVFDAVPPRDYPNAAAYRKDWQGILEAFPGPVHDTVQQFAVVIVGPVAYSHHVEDVRLTRKNGSVWHVVLRLTDVYRKTSNGWKIVQEHVSWPVDPMSGKVDFLSRP